MLYCIEAQTAKLKERGLSKRIPLHIRDMNIMDADKKKHISEKTLLVKQHNQFLPQGILEN